MARHTEPVIQLGEGRIGRTSAADDYLQIHLMAKNGTRRSVRIKAKRSIDGEKGRLVARVIGERDIRVLAEGALYFKDERWAYGSSAARTQTRTVRLS